MTVTTNLTKCGIEERAANSNDGIVSHVTPYPHSQSSTLQFLKQTRVTGRMYGQGFTKGSLLVKPYRHPQQNQVPESSRWDSRNRRD